MIDVKDPGYKKIHDGFVNSLKQRSKSKSTVIAYSKDIEQLLNFLSRKGITNINSISLEDLQAFKKSLQEQNYTPKSVSRKINSIRTFYKFLTRENMIDDNPADKLSHPKIEIKPPRVLTEMEYRALRDVCRADVRLFSIVEILLQTGIRISELANLYLEDIRDSSDNKIKYLYIREHGSHPSRKVPLNQSAYKAIQEYLEVRPESDDDHLFITKTGRPLLIRNIRTAIDKAFEKAGIKTAKVNDLRNTFIAHHLANGVSLVTVSKIVGHKRLSTTEKYLNLVKSDKPEEEKKLEAL
ncbi:tyrosine-type recombinase/integrase [Candidatus Dojkabacteria bacterium]|nr:tyrosine-type recombinase/integrase [Candidatus Dojkabacteria bacterium]